MTLAGNRLSFGDVEKACKRCADEFLRDPQEHDAHTSHAVYVSQAKGARTAMEEQEGDTDVETALAALNEDNDTDLEETDVQDILLAYKESRRLRGEQRVNCGYRPVTGRTSGGKPYRVGGRLDINEMISRTRCRICRENARTMENKCQEMARQKPYSLCNLEESTARHVTLDGEMSPPKVTLLSTFQ